MRLGLDDARLRIAYLSPPRPHAGLTFARAESPDTAAPAPLEADLATDLARKWAALTGDTSAGPTDPGLLHALDIVQSRHPVPPGGLDSLEARVLSAVAETFSGAARPIGEALPTGFDLGHPVGDVVRFAAPKRPGARGLLEIEGAVGAVRDTRGGSPRRVAPPA